MSTKTFRIFNYWIYLLLGSLFFFVLTIVFTSRIFAFETPHLYYDWNTYAPPEQVLGVQAFAQEGATPSATPAADHHNYKQFTGYLFGLGANLAPDNPLYVFKRVQEQAVLTFTFNPQAREETRLAIAGERLNEMEAMAQKGRVDLLTTLANTYNSALDTASDNLSSLKAQNQDVTTLLAKTDLEVAKHTLVLEEVSLQVPPQADQGIRTALAASEKTVDAIADLAGRPAVPAEMVDRLQSLKAQGLLTGEEVTKLIGVSSRVQAREEFRKLAEANVLPQADFKKLDETARFYYPQGYATVVEIKKFKELKALETSRPDDATLARVQDFANTYKPGDVIPRELRRWWVPLIRLEELQSTIRLDLINEDFLRNRPEDRQKYREVVERVKPRAEDIAYVNRLAATNPAILFDPAYARIKALADRFGSVETGRPPPPQAASCSRDTHWVSVPFMPNGGYCVPNIVYDTTAVTQTGATACSPGYHKTDPTGPCLPDNPYGPGAGPGITRASSASCGPGYRWVPLPQTGGYCSPETPGIGGGPYPGPIQPPSYCPSGQVFRDGKCETYNPPPAEGCSSGQWWNGQKCIQQKDCGQGYYQDSNGECKSSTEQYKQYESQCAGRPIPPGGCGIGYWDMATCSCKSASDFPDYPRPTGPYPSPGPYATPPPGEDPYKCGSGYYWTGSYCAPSTGGSYQTPSYGTPSGSYTTPYYGTPSYGTPSGTYGTPIYGTPPPYETPSYGSPTYGTPPPYGTPEYSSPPPYGTPSYGSPYGTPSYGTP